MGFLTFKVKVGVIDREREFDRIDRLAGALRDSHNLRLDANGGLDEEDLAKWLDFLEGKPVDYLEQPLPKGREAEVLEVSRGYGTPVALDESVSRWRDLQLWSDWPGPLVIKPTILGCLKGTVPAGAVGSSVFETSFGYRGRIAVFSPSPDHRSTDRIFHQRILEA